MISEQVRIQSIFDRLDYWDEDDTVTCWQWLGARSKSTSAEYGVVTVDYVSVYVHRWFYEFFFGPVPAGHEVDHLCFNTLCCNPAHLEAVTPSENRRRSRRATEQRERTHCPHGHPYEGHNLIVRRGKRECRACVYERNERNRRARRDASKD